MAVKPDAFFALRTEISGAVDGYRLQGRLTGAVWDSFAPD
jgi:hypothetical protein